MLELPHADHLEIKFLSEGNGKSHAQLLIKPFHLNRQKVLSGGVMYSMADIGMGSALYPLLKKEELCATVEIKISYLNYVKQGLVDCYSTVLKKGKRMVFFESEIYQGEKLLAKATGCYMIFIPKKKSN